MISLEKALEIADRCENEGLVSTTAMAIRVLAAELKRVQHQNEVYAEIQRDRNQNVYSR